MTANLDLNVTTRATSFFYNYQVNTSGPPQEVFKKIDDIFKRRLSITDLNPVQVPEQNLMPIPEAPVDPRSGDNIKEVTERVPQSIVDATPRVDPILNNHDLLKSDLQSRSSPSNEIKPIVSHGDSPKVHQVRGEESVDVVVSNQSSEILSDDGASKTSSTNNNSIKDENVDSVEKIAEKPEVRDEDLLESLYS